MRALAVRAENILAAIAITALAVLPLAEIFLRNAFGIVSPGAAPFALNLTLWVGLLGAAIAAREGKLLTLATNEFLPKGWIENTAHIITGFYGAAVATLFAIGGIGFTQMEYQSAEPIAMGIRMWEAVLVIPVAFGLIALRLAWRASPFWIGRLLAGLGIVAAWWMTQHLDTLGGGPQWPWFTAVLIAGLLGAPIFALLGGAAMIGILIGMGGMLPDFAVNAAHEELTSAAAGLATIPLFTLAGFLLAEGKSPQRLLRMLSALFGWIPGGTAIAAAFLCAFFTLFTGGSGVTILALGGLLLPAMVKEGYRERFSVGLLTASGSLGLLFPLSVPLILFAIVVGAAGTPIEMKHLFLGGLLPGLVLLGLVSLLGSREAIRSRVPRQSFKIREALAATWEAKWEVMLPLIVLVALFGGYAKTGELAPVAALFALIVQRFIHKDLPTNADVVRVIGDCVSLVGSVLLILCVAVGLTKYMVLMQLPEALIAWTQAHVEHRWLFLLCLNVFLLLVGTVMDIFSAIVVVAPLLLPLAAIFHVDPVHLGVIFVANLELGYLHPPLGLNMLLASVRFKKSVIEVMWATLPMLGILAVGVLLITYWEWLTLGLLRLTGMYMGIYDGS
jgi:tripartite ATP-independent transporter DctM subunit